jgi:uncharacterized membrane protein
VELRGAIPLGIIVYGLNPALVFLVAVIANILVIPLIYLFLTYCYEYFKKYGRIKGIVENSRRRAQPKVDKYGFLGLTLFVAIPLPVTGAWTGTLIAWLLGMEKKRAFMAISLGVVIAGILVTLISLFAASMLFWLGL